MYFDFEDYRPDIARVESAISWREGILISIIVHMAMVILLLTAPDWIETHRVFIPPETVAAKDDRDEPMRFVFVQPRVDLQALKPPDRGEASDIDRMARAPERSQNPANPLPFSRGNSPERVEPMDQQIARGRGPMPDPSAGRQAPPERERLPEEQSALALPAPAPPRARSGAEGRVAAGGSLGEALRNLGRYVEGDQFSNPQGDAGTFGPAIQFDTKGVEFGPWIRRFIAQVKGNWNIPLAAMTMKGHVVLTFNVHKNGFITDLAIVKPCPVEAFNYAAYGALVASNPTHALPPEYPADKAFFTVTFFYNESPQ
jgi:outer membrane biosynthesis protein TonB